MSIRIMITSLAAVACVGFSVAHGALIVNDSFDSYADQAAFQAAWPAIGTVAPTSALLSQEQSVSSPNSVKVEAESATNGKERNRQSFTETGAVDTSTLSQIVWSFDFYDSSAAASPYREYSNLQDSTAPSSTNQLISMGLNNNQSSANSGGNYYMARILGYDATTGADPDGGPNESVAGSGAYFKLNDFGVGLRSTGWHNLKVVLSTDDGLSTDYAFYVDNQLAERVSNVGTAASIRSYDNIAIGSGITNAGNAAYFDNVRLETITVPEPAALLMACIAGCGLVLRRRRLA